MFQALLLGLVLLVASPAATQHEIDPETWIEMRKMLREKGPAPSITEDVAALASPEARRAGPRLIDRGPEVLAAVHAALLAPDVEPHQALRLLQVMGALGEESSVAVVLELLRRDPKSPLRRDALLILARLPATDAAADFIGELAADEDEPWHTRRMAFTWYGLHRDARGRPQAEALRASADLERRIAGLFVLARLGDETALEPIGEILARGPGLEQRLPGFAALRPLPGGVARATTAPVPGDAPRADARPPGDRRALSARLRPRRRLAPRRRDAAGGARPRRPGAQ